MDAFWQITGIFTVIGILCIKSSLITKEAACSIRVMTVTDSQIPGFLLTLLFRDIRGDLFELCIPP